MPDDRPDRGQDHIDLIRMQDWKEEHLARHIEMATLALAQTRRQDELWDWYQGVKEQLKGLQKQMATIRNLLVAVGAGIVADAALHVLIR